MEERGNGEEKVRKKSTEKGNFHQLNKIKVYP